MGAIFIAGPSQDEKSPPSGGGDLCRGAVLGPFPISSNRPTATKVRAMNSTPYFVARSASEYGLTGSMKATLKLSAQPLPRGGAVAESLSPTSVSHTGLPAAISCCAVVASDDRRHCAVKPFLRTSRSEGRKRPVNEGCGQPLSSCTSVLLPRGTMDRRSVPTSSRSSVAENPSARVRRMAARRAGPGCSAGERCRA